MITFDTIVELATFTFIQYLPASGSKQSVYKSKTYEVNVVGKK